jgi:integrase/recombinase XerD
LKSFINSYETSDNRSKRNKNYFRSVLIYQAVTTEELKQLEPNHLKLKEGKIYVPGGTEEETARTLRTKTLSNTGFIRIFKRNQTGQY